MKQFFLFLFLSLAVIAGAQAATSSVQVTQPVKGMSGIYTVAFVAADKSLTPISKAGASLEVFEAGESVGGAVFAGPFIFGTFYLPDQAWLTLQSTDADQPTGPDFFTGLYKLNYEAVVAKTETAPGASVPTVTVLGTATVTLDPNVAGSGSTINVTITWSSGFGYPFGPQVDPVTVVQLHRVSNAPVYACLPAVQFSPVPASGKELCNP